MMIDAQHTLCRQYNVHYTHKHTHACSLARTRARAHTQGPELAPTDFMHLYSGVNRAGGRPTSVNTGNRSRPRTEQRPATVTSSRPIASLAMVRFGRFELPEHVLVTARCESN